MLRLDPGYEYCCGYCHMLYESELACCPQCGAMDSQDDANEKRYGISRRRLQEIILVLRGIEFLENAKAAIGGCGVRPHSPLYQPLVDCNEQAVWEVFER